MRARWLAGKARDLLRLGHVAALAAVAGLPFLPASPTRSADGLLHLYRLVELDQCIRQGVLFPRWVPDLAQGYGFPLFNFYPPLAYYVAEAWHVLGLSLVRSLNLTFILSAALAAVSMYLLTRDFAGELGGVIAALLYVYAPYSIYNATVRGGLSEVLAWSIAPLVLFAFRRLALEGGARWFTLATLSFAAVLLTHHITSIVLAPLVVVASVGTWFERRRGRRLAFPALALLLAVGISAFFSLPAFFEKESVQIERVFAPSDFDFHNNFRPWRSLLAGTGQADVALMNPDIPPAVGWIPVLLAIAAAVGLAWTRHKGRAAFLTALGVAAALFFFTQRGSVRVWEAIEVLKFLQFPWRLLAPLSLTLAFIGGGVALLLPARAGNRWACAVLVSAVSLALYLYNVPVLYPNRYQVPASNPGIADLLDYERKAGVLGLTSAGDYLPIWVEEIPTVAAIQPGGTSSTTERWLDTAWLPADVDVATSRAKPGDLAFKFESRSAFTAVIRQYYFPGWTAYVDWNRVPVTPETPAGLIGIEVPQGTHELQVRFQDTPLRRASGYLSLASLAALVVGAWLIRSRARKDASRIAYQPGFPVRGALLSLAVTIAFIAFKAAVLDERDTLFRVNRLSGHCVLGAAHTTWVSFGREMALIGFDSPKTPVESGKTAPITLYWQALRPMATEYSVALHLVDAQGHAWGQQDSWHPGMYPTPRWDTDQYNRDVHRVPVLPGTPPGEYDIRVGVYALHTGEPLNVLDPNDIPIGTWVTIGQVTVSRPVVPPAIKDLGIQAALEGGAWDEVELLGSSLPSDPLRPGQSLRFTLFWRARTAPSADYRAAATLRQDANPPFAEKEHDLSGQAYPTSLWAAEEIVRGQYELRIPADAPAGTAEVRVYVIGPEGPLAGTVTVGHVEIAAVERHMDIPMMDRVLNARLGEAVVLLGYNLDLREVERGAAIRLTLYWQPQAPIPGDYKVFVHLLDTNSRISAQRDGVPALGVRPTTSWVGGEVISDDYTLQVPMDAPTGVHVIEVGMYDPITGSRLPTYDAEVRPLGDRLLLEEVHVR